MSTALSTFLSLLIGVGFRTGGTVQPVQAGFRADQGGLSMDKVDKGSTQECVHPVQQPSKVGRPSRKEPWISDLTLSLFLGWVDEHGLGGVQTSDRAYALYGEWCRLNGRAPVGQPVFLSRLSRVCRKSRPRVMTPEGMRRLTCYELEHP